MGRLVLVASGAFVVAIYLSLVTVANPVGYNTSTGDATGLEDEMLNTKGNLLCRNPNAGLCRRRGKKSRCCPNYSCSKKTRTCIPRPPIASQSNAACTKKQNDASCQSSSECCSNNCEKALDLSMNCGSPF